ncbi:ribbon-helix-helix protein, CopG family [Paracoccus sp. SM22M-07]|uniref:ribbon-helix-helix protein, CopG family n=1 Tax=Paracoccus sp. SM22M-07 TaxID=1520813 RepID=UPI000922C493|nr:ribbon-helix-helix protein, CopG family [Paracoccus sp. SM22M-07]OJH43049.1 hypothetical protein IE00_18945 [Paracoccus sp. SM22M-07]
MPKNKVESPRSEDAKKANTSLRLHRKTLKALKTRAIEEDTSVQKIIEDLVNRYLKKTGSKES